MALLTERAQLAIKKEDTEGSAEALTGAEAILVFNPTYSPNIEKHRRNPARTTLSQMAPVSGKRSCVVEFDVEVAGSGAAGTAPDFGPCLLGCKMTEAVVEGTSVTYTPADSGDDSYTLAVYEDGLCVKVWGARGTWRLDAVAGQPAMIHFTFSGADFSVTDVALLTDGVSYQSSVPPAFLSASFTYGGYAAVIEKLTLDINNTVALRRSASAASGHASAVVTNRQPNGSVDPEAVLVATEDHYGEWRSATQNALSAVLGATAGNICTITAPKCVAREISPADRDGIRVLGIQFDCAMNTGGDEISLAFT